MARCEYPSQPLPRCPRMKGNVRIRLFHLEALLAYDRLGIWRSLRKFSRLQRRSR